MIEGSSGDLTDGCVSKAEMINVNTFSVCEVLHQQQIFVSSLFLDSFIQQLQYVTSSKVCEIIRGECVTYGQVYYDSCKG